MKDSTFLGAVSDDLTQRFGDKLSEVTLVFPNRRASLFFNRHLSSKIRNPIWAPAAITINDIMVKASGLTIEDPIKLVFKLHQIYSQHVNASEPIENFYFWGEVMLADFDQVDRFLVDAKQLFSNIKDLKEIESRFAGLTPEQSEALSEYLGVMDSQTPSDLKANYLKVWSKLGSIYEEFRSNLLEQNSGYEGLAYRVTAEHIASSDIAPQLPQQVAFIGFNALNACEARLFNYYKKSKEGLFYWDYHPAFTSNTDHEAGLFLRDNIARYGDSLPERESSDPFPPKVKVLAAPSEVAQSKLIPRILNELQSEGATLDESTAIVLPKENILLPTIQSLPASIRSANITMGYPAKETPAYNLSEWLVRLQMNTREGRNGTTLFYYRDVLAILNHPYIRLCEPKASDEAAKIIKRDNRIYPSSESLSATPFLKLIFSRVSQTSPPTGYIMGVCSHIAVTLSSLLSSDEATSQWAIDLEFLYSLNRCLIRLKDALDEQTLEIPHRTYLQILRKAFAQERVSFSGEPLAGLQVMGLLETRALDFENVVILSFNDDVVPGKNHPVSFITPSLRVAFGLPDYRYNDSVYANIFFSLLPKAKRVYLVYNSRSEGLSSGERSRFAMQLELEQMIGRVENIPVGYQLGVTPPTPISIEKTPQVLESLYNRIDTPEKGYVLSPSALTWYLTCPLRFYFKYCAGLKDQDEVAEEVGAMEFGNIIHATMEQLYSNFTNTTVEKAAVQSILSKPDEITNTLTTVFAKEFLKQESNEGLENISGRNALALNAMKYTIDRMLRVDRERAPFHLQSHEEKVYMPLTVKGIPMDKPLLLGGYIDRVERDEKSFFIIDYKTGGVDKKSTKGRYTSMDILFNPKNIGNNKEVLQIFCYSLAMASQHANHAIRPGLWFVRKLQPGDEPVVTTPNKAEPLLDFSPLAEEFQHHLEELISEIFDTQTPFSQTTDLKRCEYCPFTSICAKE